VDVESPPVGDSVLSAAGAATAWLSLLALVLLGEYPAV
jgi:hypothetical protein